MSIGEYAFFASSSEIKELAGDISERLANYIENETPYYRYAIYFDNGEKGILVSDGFKSEESANKRIAESGKDRLFVLPYITIAANTVETKGQ